MSELQPNLKELTEDEIDALGDKAYELDLEGKHEEAIEYLKQVPLIPGIANHMKNHLGIEAVIASGANLSKAVKEYGQEWLRA